MKTEKLVMFDWGIVSKSSGLLLADTYEKGRFTSTIRHARTWLRKRDALGHCTIDQIPVKIETIVTRRVK